MRIRPIVIGPSISNHPVKLQYRLQLFAVISRTPIKFDINDCPEIYLSLVSFG